MQRTLMSHWSCYTRQSPWLRKATVTEQSRITTLRVCSAEQRNSVQPCHTWRRPSKLNTTICISVNRRLKTACKLAIRATSTWIYALSFPRWENMNWLSNMLWRRWFWSKTSWCQRIHQIHSQTITKVTDNACLRTDLLFYASLTIILPSSRSSSNNIKLRWTPMLSQPRVQPST